MPADVTDRSPELQDLADEIAAVVKEIPDLTSGQKAFLEHRWGHQLLFFKGRVQANRKWYYFARGIVVIGAILVPALLGIDFLGSSAATPIRWVTFAVSLVVAIASALEELVGWGKRWRLYRRAHDEMKAEGWRFAELIPPAYDPAAGHRDQFAQFAVSVESIIDQYGEEYVTDVMGPIGPRQAPAAPPAVTP